MTLMSFAVCNVHVTAVGEQSFMSVSVFGCLSARTSMELHIQSCTNFLCGSVLLSRRCDTLITSGFMEDVMFAHNGEEWATQKRRILKLTR